MKKIFLMTLVALGLNGCVLAPTISKTTTSPEKTITLRYQDGLESMNKKSLVKAQNMAADYCGSIPQVTSKETKKEVDGTDANGQVEMNDFIYVTFKCN